MASRAHAGKEDKFNGRLAPGLHGMALPMPGQKLLTEMIEPAGLLIPEQHNQLRPSAVDVEKVKALVDRIDKRASKRTSDDAYKALCCAMFMMIHPDPGETAHQPVLVLVEKEEKIQSQDKNIESKDDKTKSIFLPDTILEKEKRRDWMPAMVDSQALLMESVRASNCKVPEKIFAFWLNGCAVDPSFSRGSFAPQNIVPLDLTHPASMLLWTFMTALMPSSECKKGTRSMADALKIMGARLKKPMSETEEVGSEVVVMRLLELYAYGPKENMPGSNEKVVGHMNDEATSRGGVGRSPVPYGATGVIDVPAHDCARCLWGAAECQSLCALPLCRHVPLCRR